MIKHHLTDELLMAYAAGTLPEAFSLVVATHVTLCDECRARLGAYETVGGELLDAAGTAAMADGSFEALMARVANAPRIEAPARARGAFPAPLSDYVGDRIAWRSLGNGVRQAILHTARDATVRLLHIPGGVAVPDHGHRGTELTLVLSGAFRDETDRFGPGDIEIATEELEHTPVAEPGEACICLAATDAPLRFKSLIPRLVQPFFRI